LRRRKWIVLSCVLLVPAAALFFSLQQTKQYEATAEVYIDKQNLASALTGIPDSTAPVSEDRAAATQANLASVPDVARRAIAIAETDDRTAGQLLAASSVSSKGVSDILEFKVTDPDPALAATLATAYAKAFTEYRAELDTRAIVNAREEVAAKLRALERAGRDQSQLYESLSDKEQELATLQTLQTSRAEVVRTADGAVQVSPKPVRDAVLGLVLGLVLGVGLAFAIDAIDTRVRSSAEIGEKLGLTLMGRVPPPPKKLQKGDQLVMVTQPSGTRAEAFRVLRTNLDFARLGGDDLRSILITSAVEQEGKSTTAANLAVALARSGTSVCLVDLDLRRPYLDKFFHLQVGHGITDVALGLATLEQALTEIDLATGLPRKHADVPQRSALLVADGDTGVLHVLGSGPLPPDPGEFVGTRKLAEILMELRERYDILLIDSPPLLRVGDAMTLSSRVDGLLVVTRLNLVSRPALGELARVLEAAPAPKLGYVVTGSGGQAAYAGSYAYGYGYGDAYYARDGGGKVDDRRVGVAPSNGQGDAAREEETV
jgi:Mrp family chromosome partitioning ATPase/capsular polysaccharide biosynthesis protein